MRELLALLLPLLMVAPLVADDWPQWMGPGRDNIWRESGLLTSFPKSGPRIVWRTPIAGGYAGPAVSGGRVFVTDFVTADNVKVANFQRKASRGTERVLCLDGETGEPVWKYEYPVNYAISYPAGPRCTPNVHHGKVYALGAEGHLVCLRESDGQRLWSRDLPKEFATKTALWGYASHPLIDGQKLICVVGGEGSHAVAFDKDTGREIWRALTSSQQGYSPPTIITASGVRQLILLHPDAVTSVDPETGNTWWSVPYEADSGTIIMSPVQFDNLLFVGGYSDKNLLVRLGTNKPTAEVVWRNLPQGALSPINVQPFVEKGVLYGFDHDGLLYAVDFASGERLWESGVPLNARRPVRSGTAFIVKQGSHYWMFNELGELLISKLSPAGYEEIDRAKVIEPSNIAFGRNVVWSAPAFANRRAYLRNDQECICVDLAANASTAARSASEESRR